MSGHTHTHTHTYTHNYYNPRCAHAHRGLITSKHYSYSVGLAYPAARGIGAIGQL